MDLKFLNILWSLGHNCRRILRPLEQTSPPMAVGGDVDVMREVEALQKLQECIRRVSIFNLVSRARCSDKEQAGMETV